MCCRCVEKSTKNSNNKTSKITKEKFDRESGHLNVLLQKQFLWRGPFSYGTTRLQGKKSQHHIHGESVIM